MHPVLLSVPKIPSYGVLLLLAWTVGWWLARRRSRGCGIPVWHIDWLAPLLLGGATLEQDPSSTVRFRIYRRRKGFRRRNSGVAPCAVFHKGGR